ncbi:GNAT family N-acetyltransferase [Gaiella sp.]|uniref:GNAT family N-acetyltransferase n=1 Tax=Gaiella sp. TaxID=2663207 RepID=UPI002E377324|nr:GNAT family N-acetyltransferase [Gaiella sp.]HEX5582884.1 GNAT family N-acetyltransferase [Gaiella sp.]
MTVRRATDADLDVLEKLWRAFEQEVPPPSYIDVDRVQERAEIREIVESGLAFLAERDEPVGFALARRVGSRLGRLTDLYVVPDARRDGVAAELVSAVAEALEAEGVDHLDLEVRSTNRDARAVYSRWGFAEQLHVLGVPLATLRERLAPEQENVSFASIHVQTDAVADVERAVRDFTPRIGSRAFRVVGPRNGWVAVYDEVIDSDPTVLVRFARELSSRLGAVVLALSLEVEQVVRLVALERGGIVDEYLSVPEFYGRLAPGDVIGLAANPTVLSRLTGADPQQIKALAVTAAAPGELPPARELISSIATALGLEGGEHGYAQLVAGEDG